MIADDENLQIGHCSLAAVFKRSNTPITYKMKTFVWKILCKIVERQENSADGYVAFINQFQSMNHFIRGDIFRDNFKWTVRLLTTVSISTIGMLLLLFTFLTDTKIEKCKSVA